MTVTVWSVFQLVEVKVRLYGLVAVALRPLTLMSALSEVMATVTLPVGCVSSTTV